jgi:hypothetical protein
MRGNTPVRVRLTGVLAGAMFTVAITGSVMLWAPWSDGTGAAPAARDAVPVAWQRPAVSGDGLTERTGVQITQLAVTGAGGLVDLRYRVVDPDRANAIHDARTPPGLVDEKTGLVVHRLLMDHAHTGPYTAGVTYYLVFTNPGNRVKRGDRVSVLLGDTQVEHVAVR